MAMIIVATPMTTSVSRAGARLVRWLRQAIQSQLAATASTATGFSQLMVLPNKERNPPNEPSKVAESAKGSAQQAAQATAVTETAMAAAPAARFPGVRVSVFTSSNRCSSPRRRVCYPRET